MKGSFHCRKNDDNTRELDVEIHYSVLRLDDDGKVESPKSGGPPKVSVQTFKVR